MQIQLASLLPPTCLPLPSNNFINSIIHTHSHLTTHSLKYSTMSSSFPKATMNPSSNSNSNTNNNMNDGEPRWVIQMRKTLEEEVDQDENETPVCISNVPKALMAFKPEAYTPQQVALGPYHHWRPELYEMSRHKLVAAKKTQKQLINGLKFQHIVDNITKLDRKIRASYQKYLDDFNSETLAWLLAVDASFLLQFLEVYAIKEGKSSLLVTRASPLSSGHMSHFIDYAGRRSSHNVILRDIMMLENQIPLFLLRKILEIQYSSLEIADDILYSMFVGICKEVTPFKMMDLNSETISSVKLTECAHLLDFLYRLLVPARKPKPAPTQDRDYNIEINEAEDDDAADEDPNNREPSKNKGDEDRESFGQTSHVGQLLNEVWKFVYKLNRPPIRLLKTVLLSKPVMLALKLPWAVISRLPIFSLLKQPIEQLFFNQDKEEIKPENEGSSKNTNGMSKIPLMEEITIPSVTELYKAGVRFVATNGNIDSISFDVSKATLYLPSVSLDVNTDVILRNLVAYEASTVTGPLVFTRYTELMNGIIDTDEDSMLLREKGIVLNHLKSDEEVANLWNGMNKSVRLTKVPLLDKLIEDVNKCYNGKWRVKMMKFMKTYVFGSWQFLTFLAAILLLLMTGLQAVCSVYTCARILRVQAVTTN